MPFNILIDGEQVDITSAEINIFVGFPQTVSFRGNLNKQACCQIQVAPETGGAFETIHTFYGGDQINLVMNGVLRAKLVNMAGASSNGTVTADDGQ